MDSTSEKNEKTKDVPAPCEAARSAWLLPNPKAMPLSRAVAPVLDQVASQQISATPHHHTPWQWAEPLRLLEVRAVRGGQEVNTNLGLIPVRQARITVLVLQHDEELPTTSLYQTVKATLGKPVGEFSAGRFSNVPGTLDMIAIACIVRHFEGTASNGPDEVPFLRCALLGDLALSAGNIKKLTQLPTRVAPSLSITRVTRTVTGFRALAPNGNQAAYHAAKDNHNPSTAVTGFVCFADVRRHLVAGYMRERHPDPRVAAGKPPWRLPHTGHSRRDCVFLHRLGTGDNYTAERRHQNSGRSSPYCGDLDTLKHLLLKCPACNASRQAMLSVYSQLGLPRSTTQHLLFPECHRKHVKHAFSTLLDFLDHSGLREHI
ncbi:hypothetical protein MTO96_023765 [Rhipicephalus appendiculatus]